MDLELTHDISSLFIFILVCPADGELIEEEPLSFLSWVLLSALEGYIAYAQYILSKRVDKLAWLWELFHNVHVY